jgi:hypothetical protein
VEVAVFEPFSLLLSPGVCNIPWALAGDNLADSWFVMHFRAHVALTDAVISGEEWGQMVILHKVLMGACKQGPLTLVIYDIGKCNL